MKQLLVVAALICALIPSARINDPTCHAQTGATKPAAPADLAAKSAQVDALLATINQPNTPGVAVLVIREGQVAHHRGYGLSRLDNKEPISPDTAFDLASTSKPFTALAVMMLAERGKLSYEDPLAKFFPEFPSYAQKITIRNLLTHTSGLPDVINASWFKPGYQPSSKEVAAFVTKEASPKSTPGDRFEYNNAGYLLLAVIVEKVSGQSFASFVRENIFKPLGMNHTLIWDETKPKVERMAGSYARDDNSFIPINPVSDTFVYGAKGVISTTNDLSKWITGLDSQKLVKSETLQNAFAPMKLNDGSLSPYGFGWGLGSDNGLPMIEHPGGYLGYRANIRIYPSHRLAIAVLSNNAQADVQALTRSIGRIYLGDRMVAPQAKAKLDAAVLNSYVGRYQSDSPPAPGLMIEISLENGELFITSALRPKTKLLAQSQTEFQIGETTASVTFNRDEKGVNGLALKTRMGIINARRVN